MGQALDKLSPRRRAFVVAYVAGDTAGQVGASYTAAGYSLTGDAASKAGSRLLKIVEVQEAIAELRAEVRDKAEAEKVLSASERHEILAEIARDDADRKAQIAAIKLDAELRGDLTKKRPNEKTPARDEKTPAERIAAANKARLDLERKGFRVVK